MRDRAPFVQVLLAAWGAALAGALGVAAERAAGQEPKTALPDRLWLQDGWLIQSAVLVDAPDERIATTEFTPQGWYPTSVPATALAALIRNGVYPDFRIGLNSFRIPDASDAFNQKYDLARYSHLPDQRNPWKDPYWYRTEFTLPDMARGKRVWLNFDGLNYRADVWLNGVRVADARQVVGSFARYRFDVTECVRAGQKNCLAVKAYPVDHPGVPDAQLEVLGRARNYHKEIMKDVTLVMSIGYDCMPTVPDRHIGLWQPVYLEFTGPVAIRHPFVVTRLPLPRTSPAQLTVSAELHNASKAPQHGVLRGRIEETGGTVQAEGSLGPGETKEVVFTPAEHPTLRIDNPRLWWPHGYGDQPLYHLRLGFELAQGVSDEARVPFGIRQVTKELYKLDDAHGLRVYVNGQRVFCRGGYLQPEILFQWDARRIDAEVRYLTAANLNIVYFEDVPNPPDAFLDACDRYGLMFGNCFYGCFWMTPGSGRPEDVALVEQGTIDILRRYRNHPSLVLYMAMNEGDTREDVYQMWRKHIVQLDGTRLWIPSGSFPDYRKDVPEWIKQDLPVGTNDYPPKSYGWVEPAQYFRWVRESRNWMFMLESGSASLPPMDSLRKFIPDLESEAPGGARYPLTPTWAHHGANAYYKPYDDALRRIFGPPESVLDYCRKGHLLTYDQHRAMYEAANHRMWEITSGFSEWKLNACWPTVQWHLYDWFLKPMVSFYAVRKACEPLHVQLTPLDSMVSVINHRLQAQTGLGVRARVYDLQSKLRWEHRAVTDVEANAFREVFAILPLPDLTPVYFVRLDLTDATGKPVSNNFYWLARSGSDELGRLADFPLVPLKASLRTSTEGSETVATVQIENPTDRLALLVHAAITQGPYGEEVVPVWWEDNYLGLVPGESRELTARFATADLGGAVPVLEMSGWNVESPIECTALEVSQARVRPGEPLTVTARVANTCLEGSPVALDVDGQRVAVKWLWARAHAGITRQVTFPLKCAKPGRHELRVGQQTVSVLVE